MIWCVEDDASIRDIEIYALKSAGYQAARIRGRNLLLGGCAKRKSRNWWCWT